MKIRKAVIPAAGLGTRFLPATKAVPKEMLPIVDKPVIQYLVEEAAASGIEQVIIITNDSKRAIEEHFSRMPYLEARLAEAGKHHQLTQVRQVAELASFVYVNQPVPLGNGHAVLMAREIVGDEPFAVLWGDDVVVSRVPCLQQMIRVYERYGCSVLAAMRVPARDYPKYGMLRTQPLQGRVSLVEEIVEKPSIETCPSDLAQVKGFIFTPAIFSMLEQTPPKNGEIWLADAVERLLDYQSVCAYEFTGRRYDTGNVLEYIKAQVEVALRRSELRAEMQAYLRDIAASAEATDTAGGQAVA